MMAGAPCDGSDEIELSEDFEPSCHDAIVGWARQNYHHCEYDGFFVEVVIFLQLTYPIRHGWYSSGEQKA